MINVTKEFNKFVKQNVAEKLNQPNLSSKTDIADFLKTIDFVEKLIKNNEKVTSNKLNNHITSI